MAAPLSPVSPAIVLDDGGVEEVLPPVGLTLTRPPGRARETWADRYSNSSSDEGKGDSTAGRPQEQQQQDGQTSLDRETYDGEDLDARPWWADPANLPLLERIFQRLREEDEQRDQDQQATAAAQQRHGHLRQRQ